MEPCPIQNPDTSRTLSIFKSLSNMCDDQAYSGPWHSQKSLFKHFQGYLGIFRNISAYSATLTGAPLRESKISPVLFQKPKNSPNFAKKYPDCVHLWVKFSFQNVLIVSWRKKLQNDSLQPLLAKCSSSTKPPLPWINSSCVPALRHYFFYKMLHVKPIQNGGRQKGPSTSFSPVTSTNIGISPQNYLTFSFNPFITLV